MQNKRHLLVFCAVLYALCAGVVLFAAVPPDAGEEHAGAITQVRGAVTVRRIGADRPAAARERDVYHVGDTVETGAGSAAQLSLTDESFLNVGQNSAVRVNQYSYDPAANRRTARISVLKGRVRCVLFRTRGNGSLFYSESGQAAVVHGMQSDLVIEAGARETVITVLAGTAGVKNVLNYVIGEIQAGSNQRVAVRSAQPPSSPETLPPRERKAFLTELTF